MRSTAISILAAALLLLPATLFGQAVVRPGLADLPPLFLPEVDPQNAALAGTSVPAGVPSSSVLFANPAALMLLDRGGDAGVGYMDWGRFSHLVGSASFRLRGAARGVVGAAARRIHYDGGVRAGGVSAAYARSLSEPITVGFRLKYRFWERNEWEDGSSLNTTWVREQALETDLALLYSLRPDLYRTSLIAVNVMPHQLDPLRSDGSPSLLPRRVVLSGAVDMSGLWSELFASHETVWLTTGLEHAVALANHASAGVEYIWHDRLSLRAGYRLAIQNLRYGRRVADRSARFGVGLRQPIRSVRFRLDYALQVHNWRSGVHRLAGSVAF